MNKENLKQIKQIIDVTINFLKLISEYLNKTVTAIILPWRNMRKK